jgi:hypothetical protein
MRRYGLNRIGTKSSIVGFYEYYAEPSGSITEGNFLAAEFQLFKQYYFLNITKLKNFSMMFKFLYTTPSILEHWYM